MRNDNRKAFVLAGAVMIWLGVTLSGFLGAGLIGAGMWVIYRSLKKKA
ncbi:MAG: hypothetical protein K6B74_10670 [Ruminococcus sp.]|nr:hypothetical protein [Ruminococcus sp.]